MHLRLITPPPVEPISLLEAKAHLRVDGSQEDSLISALIVAARERAEKITGKAFITQTWELYLDEVPKVISLYRPPIRSVASVTIDGRVLPTTAYEIDLAGARLRPRLVWPRPQNLSGLVIRYSSGYGDVGAQVPQAIRQAILLTVAHWFENRESQEMPSEAKLALLDWREMAL